MIENYFMDRTTSKTAVILFRTGLLKRGLLLHPLRLSKAHILLSSEGCSMRAHRRAEDEVQADKHIAASAKSRIYCSAQRP